jgi:hypothetical protein
VQKRFLKTASILFVFAISLRQIADFDLWTHLSEGEALMHRFGWSSLTSILREVFFAGANEKPFQIAIYLAYTLGGGALLSVGTALIASCIFLPFLSLVPADLRQDRTWLLGALLCTAAAAASFRFVPRPELVGYLLFALLLASLQTWVRTPSAKPLLAVAALLLAWEPIHVSWTIGMFYAVLFILLWPHADFFRSRLSTLPLMASRILIGICIALVSYGLYRAGEFAFFVIRNIGSGGILSSVTEMRPTWEFPEYFGLYCAASLFSLLCALFTREGRIRRITVWACSFLLGITVIRNVGFAVLAQLPGAIEGLAAPLSASSPARGPARRALSAISLLIVIVLLFFSFRNQDPPSGIGIAWEFFPREAAQFVHVQRLPEPVFNNWDCGGYLRWVWKEHPSVFLDGRLGSQQKLDDHERILEAQNAEYLFNAYGINTVIIQGLYLNNGRILPAVSWLLLQPHWQLVHAADALVFVRASHSPLPRIPSIQAWLAILKQIDQRTPILRTATHLSYSRAVAQANSLQLDAARETFQEALREQPDLARVYAPLGHALGLLVH